MVLFHFSISLMNDVLNRISIYRGVVEENLLPVDLNASQAERPEPLVIQP